jgi:hypothetical protein
MREPGRRPSRRCCRCRPCEHSSQPQSTSRIVAHRPAGHPAGDFCSSRLLCSTGSSRPTSSRTSLHRLPSTLGTPSGHFAQAQRRSETITSSSSNIITTSPVHTYHTAGCHDARSSHPEPTDTRRYTRRRPCTADTPGISPALRATGRVRVVLGLLHLLSLRAKGPGCEASQRRWWLS